jgi:magnesium transporter
VTLEVERMDGLKASWQGQDRKLGLPPGTVVYVGKDQNRKPQMQLLAYGADATFETNLSCAGELDNAMGREKIQWLNLDGLNDVALLEELGRRFDIHPLTLSDIANTHQRPKFELFDHYAFLTFKMLRMEESDHHPSIIAEHVGLVLGRNLVISFQEAPGDVFGFVRDRIRSGRGKIRRMKADYLAYSLLDAVVDGYFSVLESLGDRISELDDDLLQKKPSPGLLREVHALKQQVIYIRRCAWPLRELVSAIQKVRSDLFDEKNDMYFRDLYDHCVQVIDTIETYRDLLSSLTDLYMSIAGNRMNEIMKVLTIIATIFIPLTFVAGVYGMNFEYMPELHHAWAYPGILLLMLFIAAGMLFFFRRKGWL